jgi:hypothetical protein
MENLFHKTYFMRHNSSFSIFFLAIFLISSFNSIAGSFSSSSSVAKTKKTIIINAKSAMNDLPKPVEPVSKPEEPAKKPHLLKTEELAHIHHFHKERVKKLKYHHKKFWMLSKIILILCHLGLLICAYLHLINV